ncbi:hypothetical protein PsYK624_120130 [Phanerochaete sordida]|uniref:Uncharacterized protein n=1 Tax=Phanerochaete sordida TaxID=48140 RepID=A0A9P3GH03_9APHY|nr:hypothetical protein PsYK624_120130 [Phanerochaete sordida]
MPSVFDRRNPENAAQCRPRGPAWKCCTPRGDWELMHPWRTRVHRPWYASNKMKRTQARGLCLRPHLSYHRNSRGI